MQVVRGSQETGLELLGSPGIIETMGTLGNGQNVFFTVRWL